MVTMMDAIDFAVAFCDHIFMKLAIQILDRIKDLHYDKIIKGATDKRLVPRCLVKD